MTTASNEEKGSSTTEPQSSAGTARTILLSQNCIDSRDLFVATREIAIEHGGETYRLRLTAQNKLILTK